MITIYNCGYDSRHQSAFEMHRTHTPDYTLLLVKTSAYFHIDGQPMDTQPGTAVLYDKQADVWYGSRRPDYNDDWIHFDLEQNDMAFLESLKIPRNVPFLLRHMGQLSEYARMIVLEKNSGHLMKEQILDSLMRALLLSVSSQLMTAPDYRTSHKYYDTLNRLRMSILNAPHKKWTIGDMSATLHMSPSYLQHLYKQFFGTSCMQDVINARLKNARFYLRTTDMSIQALAEFIGYDNELHFMRQFKQQEGMTPTQYREKYRSW